jgi:hypothetical protein
VSAVFEGFVAAGEEGGQACIWTSLARSYAAFGSPLVPGSEDVEILESAVFRHAASAGSKPLRAIMLGVTPAVALMRWPPASRILAIDNSPTVVRALWPGDIPGVREARCATWVAIPVEKNSCDVIVGDGSLNACRFPEEVREILHSISGLLVDDGMFACRCYIRPHSCESVGEVFDALFSNSGLTVDRFKMRLFMAMQRSPEEGVIVREAARILDRYKLDRRVMTERLGWSRAAIEPFNSWRFSETVYSIPSLEELREVLGECFEEVSITYPGYELGQYCPTLVMRPRVRHG